MPVENFSAFLGRSPNQASAEDLRRYQLHMRSIGASATSMNSVVSALRFFFGVTLGRGDAEVGMTTVREPRRLPVVLSPEEVARLLNAAQSSSPGGLKYRAAFSVAYGAGLRASEVVALKISDIDSDSERMVIRVEPGKGRKDRYAMLSEPLLHLLRAWRLAAREPDPVADADQPPMLSYPCPSCGGPTIVIETFEPGHPPRAPTAHAHCPRTPPPSRRKATGSTL